MNLDPRTIVVVNCIGTFLMSTGLWVISRGHLSGARGVRSWALATGFQCLGWFLFALRGVLDDFTSIVLANTLILLALAQYSQIIMAFVRDVRRNWMYIFVGLAFVVLTWLVWKRPDLAFRIIVTSATMVVFCFSSAFTLFSKYRGRTAPKVYLGAVFMLCGTVALVRVVYYAFNFHDEGQGAFQSTVEQNIAYLTYHITAVMLTFGFLLIANDHYVHELKIKEREVVQVKDRLNEAQKLGQMGSWEWNIETNKLTWSEEQFILFGEDPERFEVSYESYCRHLSPQQQTVVYELIRNAVLEKSGYSVEHEITRPDGSKRFVAEQGHVVVNKDSKPIRIIGTALDITLRKSAEIKLQETKQYFQDLIEYSSAVIILLDARGAVMYQSPRAKSILGYDIVRDENLSLFDLLNSDDAEKAKLLLKGLEHKPGRSATREFRLAKASGAEIWLEGTITNLLYNPFVNAFVCNYHDITYRKYAEEALRLSEERWKFAVEGSNDGIWDWNLNTMEVYRSTRLLEILGYDTALDPSYLRNWEVWIHPDDIGGVRLELQQHFLKNSNVYYKEYRVRCNNGEYIWVLDRGKVIIWNDDGTPARMVGTYTDISERKRADEALQESESKFRLLAEGAREMICRHDAQRRWTYLSPATFEVTGWSPEELIGKDPIDFTHEDDIEWVQSHLAASLLGGESIYTEFRFRKKDGTYCWLERASRPLRNEAGAVVEYHETSREVTERKLIQQKLISEQQLLRTIIDNIPINIYVKDLKSRKVLVNRAEIEFMGRKNEEELLGKDDYQLFPPESAVISFREDQEVLAGRSIINLETLNVRMDGSETWFLTSKIPIKDFSDNITGLVGISIDITAMKRAQNKIIELSNTKDKFFSIVAHDLKSPLNALRSFAEILINHINHISKEEIIRISKELKISVDNTIKLTDNLITWARMQMNGAVTNPTDIQIKDIVDPIYDIYKDAAAIKNIQIDTSVSKGLRSRGDLNQLTFVVRNLVNNAIKFTPRDGRVMVQAFANERRQVLIKVIDNGVGMTDAMRARIFALKVDGSERGTDGEKGTGLGMMLSYEFVRVNNGTIDVTSSVGAGTTFTVTLPQVV